jgi:hypothetical protein
MNGPDAGDLTRSEPSYAFRPSLMGSPREFQLTSRGLRWQTGNYGDLVPYDRVRRLRLSFRPATMQGYRFIAELWPASGPKLVIASTSARSMFDHARQDAAYSAFVVALCRRIGAAGGQATLEAGSSPLIYWPGVIVFAVASFGLAALAVRALAVQAFVPAAVIAGFLALFLWQSGNFFRRNRPQKFSPDFVPPEVLPRP